MWSLADPESVKIGNHIDRFQNAWIRCGSRSEDLYTAVSCMVLIVARKGNARNYEIRGEP
jgi:hypothetical protein